MDISENRTGIGKESISENKGEIVVYQPDEITRLEVKVNEDTVWLTQTQIAQLFGVGQPAISKHLKNIFASGSWISRQFIPFWNILLQMGSHIRPDFIILMPSYPSAIA